MGNSTARGVLASRLVASGTRHPPIAQSSQFADAANWQAVNLPDKAIANLRPDIISVVSEMTDRRRIVFISRPLIRGGFPRSSTFFFVSL